MTTIDYYSGKIASFLSLDEKSKLLNINKTWEKKIMIEIKNEEDKLKKFINKNFKDEIIQYPFILIQNRRIHNIVRQRKNPTTKLLMKAFTKNLANKNLYIFDYKDWIRIGNSYVISFKYLSMGYSATLVYLYKKGNFEITYYGGSNGMDAYHNNEIIKRLEDGTIENIYKALDIMMDNIELHKYLRKN